MPYTYTKSSNGDYVVYHKNPDGSRGKKVGETGKTKEDLNKYLAALHMHEGARVKAMIKLLEEYTGKKVNLK